MSANKYAHTVDQCEANERGKLKKITHKHKCTHKCKLQTNERNTVKTHGRRHLSLVLFSRSLWNQVNKKLCCFILAQARTPFICILHLGDLIAAFAMIRCIGWKVLVICVFALSEFWYDQIAKIIATNMITWNNEINSSTSTSGSNV